MKFIFGGEGFWGWLDRATYRGAIGLFYSNTWSFILAVLILAIVCILAVIGLITVISLLVRPKKTKSGSSDKWLKTGKW